METKIILRPAYLVSRNEDKNLFRIRQIKIDWNPAKESLTSYAYGVCNQLLKMLPGKEVRVLALAQKSEWIER